MRRSSAQLHTQTSEPLIVVEDSYYDEEQEEEKGGGGGGEAESQLSFEDESPTMNPYLLSPYAREIRKHSLPTPQCSGITASQVRRLSERGETVGPGPRQAEFLATLSTAITPTPGGRRHSVVTISKVPTTLFGRNRRESVAAFSSGTGFPSRVLPNRRESIACPPSTEPRGSVHNLQLDIMDDIVQARKVRMKMWNTSSEKVCEVQPLDEAGGVQRYTNAAGRRYSDFVGTTLAPIPSSGKRRASELPQPPITTACTSTSARKPPAITGIVCSNTDLISILSLTTSSTEINQCEASGGGAHSAKVDSPKTVDRKRGRLKSNRSNSFDVSILQQLQSPEHSQPDHTPSNWFAKRHQPKPESKTAASAAAAATCTPECVDVDDVVETEPGKVIWDERSGSLVDAHALGSAIEVFLRQTTPDAATHPPEPSPKSSPNKTNNKATNKSAAGRSKTSWFSGNKGDSDNNSTETCDSSLCSTLKDLFVK